MIVSGRKLQSADGPKLIVKSKANEISDNKISEADETIHNFQPQFGASKQRRKDAPIIVKGPSSSSAIIKESAPIDKVLARTDCVPPQAHERSKYIPSEDRTGRAAAWLQHEKSKVWKGWQTHLNCNSRV